LIANQFAEAPAKALSVCQGREFRQLLLRQFGEPIGDGMPPFGVAPLLDSESRLRSAVGVAGQPLDSPKELRMIGVSHNLYDGARSGLGRQNRAAPEPEGLWWPATSSSFAATVARIPA
jgi:hypothetical protein